MTDTLARAVAPSTGPAHRPRQAPRFRLALAAFALLLGFSPASNANEETTSRLDTLIEAYRDVYGFAGTTRIVAADTLVLERSVGLAERAFRIEHQPDTRGSINSISKTFTAVAVLRLAERGQLELDTPLRRLLPGLEAPWADAVTPHHLLSHSSGLPREAGLPANATATLKEQLETVAGLSLAFEPGTDYGYSNVGYILLGNVLEAVTGADFASVIENEVLKPAGLQDTGVYRGRRIVDRQAVPYRIGPNGVVEAQRTKTLGENAGGGMYSTAADLERFVRALEDDTLLGAKWRRQLFAPHAGVGDGGHEAYAWSIKNFGPTALRFSAGSGYGTKSVVVRDPESGLFIAIVSNWGTFPILDLLRDLFLVTQGADVTPPDATDLATPDALATHLGRFRFEAGVLQTALQTEDDELVLHRFGDRVFLDDELLAVKSDGAFGLTYTDELLLRFEGETLVLSIGGQTLRGSRLN